MAAVLARASLARRLPCSTRPLAQLGRPVVPRNFSSEACQKQSPFQKFWSWTSQERPHWRKSYTEAAVIFCVFGCVGSSSVKIVRPILKEAGVEGSMKEGPWSYRIANFSLVTLIYPCVLITFGTLAGRHVFFKGMAKRIIGHFVPRSLHGKIGLAAAVPAAAGAAVAADAAAAVPVAATTAAAATSACPVPAASAVASAAGATVCPAKAAAAAPAMAAAAVAATS